MGWDIALFVVWALVGIFDLCTNNTNKASYVIVWIALLIKCLEDVIAR